MNSIVGVRWTNITLVLSIILWCLAATLLYLAVPSSAENVCTGYVYNDQFHFYEFSTKVLYNLWISNFFMLPFFFLGLAFCIKDKGPCEWVFAFCLTTAITFGSTVCSYYGFLFIDYSNGQFECLMKENYANWLFAFHVIGSVPAVIGSIGAAVLLITGVFYVFYVIFVLFTNLFRLSNWRKMGRMVLELFVVTKSEDIELGGVQQDIKAIETQDKDIETTQTSVEHVDDDACTFVDTSSVKSLIN